MHPYHRELVRQIKKQAAEAKVPLQAQGDRYVGTLKPCYMFRAAVFSKIKRNWIRRHPDLTLNEYIDLLNSLSQGATYNEFVFVGILLGALPHMRQALEPHQLDRWLDHAQGWAEVDTICQSNFTAQEMLVVCQASFLR